MLNPFDDMLAAPSYYSKVFVTCLAQALAKGQSQHAAVNG